MHAGAREGSQLNSEEETRGRTRHSTHVEMQSDARDADQLPSLAAELTRGKHHSSILIHSASLDVSIVFISLKKDSVHE